MDKSYVLLNPSSGNIKGPEVLFIIVSIITIYAYFGTANLSNLEERRNFDITTTTWAASLSVVWGLATLALRNGPPISYWTSLLILPTALIYGKIAELPGLKDSAEGMTKTKSGITALSVSAAAIFLYLLYIIYNVFGYGFYYAFMFFLPVIIFGLWILIWINMPEGKVQSSQSYYDQKSSTVNSRYVYDKLTYKFRIHHWMIALIGVLISKHQTIISDLGLGIFWGIFIQELAAYGIDIPVDHT
jgi:hypothetical protein